MRDLRTRLRAIVRQDVARRDRPPGRELTYLAGADAASGAAETSHPADRLGAQFVDGGRGACLAIDREWPVDAWHGRRRLESYLTELSDAAPLSMFDHRPSTKAGWADRVVFFDVETTGLSGGAGTLAFLAGFGWIDGERFRVRQFLLSGPSGETAMLDQIGRIFDEASLVVTYNGRTFDVPLMDTRWAFHRTSSPTDDLPHFDMLPPARRLWGAPVADSERSCSLGALERSVLGFHRLSDVPGFEVPARYFYFLRTQDAAAIEGVLDHNRYDVVSLAALMGYALWLAREGPLACRDDREQFGLGRLYERAGDRQRALEAYDLAARSSDREIRRFALNRMAILLRRDDRYDDAAAAWQGVLSLADDHERCRTLKRRAAEALAIYHEHRAKNFREARRYAEVLRRATTGSALRAADHRVQRITRKIQGKQTQNQPTFLAD